MTVPSPPEGRTAYTFLSDAENTTPTLDPLVVVPPPSAPFLAHQRELSAGQRGRTLSITSPRNASPRGPVSTSQPRGKQSTELERKPSTSYGHHRQVSMVNGVQILRNHNRLASVSSSPLSPSIMTTTNAQDPSSFNTTASLYEDFSPSVTDENDEYGMDMVNSATLPVNQSTELNTTTVRKVPERRRSARTKPSQDAANGSSRAHGPQEPMTVGEYASKHLFESFVEEADRFIEICRHYPGRPEPRIESICGPNADPAFDQLISSLAHVNRYKPRNLIDAIMAWRHGKSDAANKLYNELRTIKDPFVNVQRVPGADVLAHRPVGQRLSVLESNVHLAEQTRKTSIYILCRVLIEIISQTTAGALLDSEGTIATVNRLEDVIYDQLRTAEPEILARENTMRANWIMRGQVLGAMSRLRFEEVSTRFMRDLEHAQKKLSVKGLIDTKLIARTGLLVRSMRGLQIRTQPEAAWEQSCDMIHQLVSFFNDVHGRHMKHAYAELLEQLLLPLITKANAEFNAPKWREVFMLLQPKLTQMLSKADHWPYIFPLSAVLLCASPNDIFSVQWFQQVTSYQLKSRDRPGRSHILKAICRIVWRYLYQQNDASLAIAKRLDEIVKLVFHSNKRVVISSDPIIADPLIQLIRIIGFKNQDICFRNIIFPLMNSDLFSSPEKELKIENLDPERTVVAIRAFLAVVSDLEKGEAPPFPEAFECDAESDLFSMPTVMPHRRTRSQGAASTIPRSERLSRPILTTKLNDVSRDYYNKFCKMLGQLTIICDNTFGGQAVLDEKFASQAPKTPMAEAFTFNKKTDDLMNPTDLRQNYYDLLHVAVEALPRCFSTELPITPLINLLCTGTAHVQQHIAASSAQSLKSIARQSNGTSHSYAQQVTINFARFIFNFDDRYATVSDGSLIGPGHIESTLKLYLELLQIWIDSIPQRSKQRLDNEDEEKRNERKLDTTGILAYVEEVESHGLFFLCSPSQNVRAIAVDVLRLVTKFDTALGTPTSRIISILEGGSQQVIDVNDERLTTAERSRLQKGLRAGDSANDILVDLCSSDSPIDSNLWTKVFPHLIRLSSQSCPQATVLTRELVCQRLSHSHRTITALGDGHRDQVFSTGRTTARLPISSPEIVIDQWKIHLVFACTTLTHIGGTPYSSTAPNQVQHTRKSSKSSSTSTEKIMSATELFSKVVVFLSVPNPVVRAAAIAGLGATNVTLFQTLLETLQPHVNACSLEAKERLASHQRSISNPRRSRHADVLRTEITHLLSLTSHHLRDPAVLADDYVLPYLSDYTKHLRIFLSDIEVQRELELQRLRIHFCNLIDVLYENVRTLKKSNRWISFQSRQATFALMEEWCGFSPLEPQLQRQREHIRRSILEREGDYHNRKIIDGTFEKERQELQHAALTAMATLCAGQLNFFAKGEVINSFDVRRLHEWINAVLEDASDRKNAIGRKALKNLIVHNLNQPQLMAQALRMCYHAKSSKALGNYFEVVTQILTENTGSDITPFWKILCAALYTLGNEDSQIRAKSARLLRTLEERSSKNSKLQDLEMSVSDRTTAVYKLAQFEISCRLASQHSELGFHVFSECSQHFNELQPDHQRNMVSCMLPWLQAIELQLEPDGKPTATTYMLLVNLFQITVKSSKTLHNEIQALWQALATGPHGGNVQLVLDFIIMICLDKKESTFVLYAKQIVVFLSKTPAGAGVVDHLLIHISPKNMVGERKDPIRAPADNAGLPYTADLDMILPSGAKQYGLSLGQLSMILLVDLVVSPFQLPPDKVPTLLQIILSQWDQNVAVVQDNARELLVHLIHELVISRLDGSAEKKSIEDFVDLIRREDSKISWSYSDYENRPFQEDARAVSESMDFVVGEVVRIFSLQDRDLEKRLGAVTIQWAISCAVRQVACRSFQLFRCVCTTFDQSMLADMLARLANTISDSENHEYTIFALEILTTLRTIVNALDTLELFPFPQLFWATCACLDTIFEREFQEGLGTLDLLLQKLDLSDPAVTKHFLDTKPPKWNGVFEGLHPLVYKGMRSSESMAQTLRVMERLVQLPSNEITGGDERLSITVLANLPGFLRTFESTESDAERLRSASVLAAMAASNGRQALAAELDAFSRREQHDERQFLSRVVAAIREKALPQQEFDNLVFLLGLVNNKADWFKVNVMKVLDVVISSTDMRRPDIVNQGPDLISPLLRVLQTPHYRKALQVLDSVIDLTSTARDEKHLRMSMTASHSTRAIRKEYDSTKSLYGIPEVSGWSIPMPAHHSSQTRANVHAVVSTLDHVNAANGFTPIATPEIEFHKDDWAHESSSYFTERSATMMSEDTRVTDSNMGELAEKLDTLDDFFDDDNDDDSTSTGQLSVSTNGLYSIGAHTEFYGQRRGMPTSYHQQSQQYNDPRFTQTSHEMNPAAFAYPQQAHPPLPSNPHRQIPTNRHHSRSITSPATTLRSLVRTSPPRPIPAINDHLASGDEAGDEQHHEPFSDDEISIGRAYPMDDESARPVLGAAFSPTSNAAAAAMSAANMSSTSSTSTSANNAGGGVGGGFKAGLRSGIRRLTSSGGNREALRMATTAAVAAAQQGRGPRVPQVPAGYLNAVGGAGGQGPFSAEP